MGDLASKWVELDESKALDYGLITEARSAKREGTVRFRAGYWDYGPIISAIPRSADCGGGWWVVLWVWHAGRTAEDSFRWGVKRLFKERWEAFQAAQHLCDLTHAMGYERDSEDIPKWVVEMMQSIDWYAKNEPAPTVDPSDPDLLDSRLRLPGSFQGGRRRR